MPTTLVASSVLRSTFLFFLRKKMETMTKKERWKGALCAFCGVAAVSPDACLIRLSQGYGGTGAIVFAKSGFGGLLSMVVARYLDKRQSYGRSLGERAWEGWPFLVSLFCCQALLGACFTVGFAYTYAANVVVLSSLSPLLSAVFARVAFKDRLPYITVAALGFATLAVFVMFAKDLEAEQTTTRRHVLGNLCGAAAAILNSIFLLVARAGLGKFPEMPVALATALGSLMTAFGAFVVEGSSVLSVSSLTFYVAMFFDGAGLACVQLAYSTAPRYATAAEIGMVSLVGLVLSPAWVALFYDEIPPSETIKGGALLLVNLVVHEGLALRAEKHQQHDDTTKKMGLLLIEQQKKTLNNKPKKELGGLGITNMKKQTQRPTYDAIRQGSLAYSSSSAASSTADDLANITTGTTSTPPGPTSSLLSSYS